MWDAVVSPFHLGVVAPLGFDPPSLGAAVSRSLFGLLARRHRTQPIRLTTVIGEPIAWAVAETADRFGWHVSYRGSPQWPPSLGLLRVAVEVAAFSDALVFFFGDHLPADLARVRDLCPWLGTEFRCIPIRYRDCSPHRPAG